MITLEAFAVLFQTEISPPKQDKNCIQNEKDKIARPLRSGMEDEKRVTCGRTQLLLHQSIDRRTIPRVRLESRAVESVTLSNWGGRTESAYFRIRRKN